MKLFILLTLYFSLCACIKVSDPDSHGDQPENSVVKSPESQVIRDAKAEADKQAFVSYTDEPNSYAVHIPMSDEIQVIQRRDVNEMDSNLAIKNLFISTEDSYQLDSSVVPGKTYLYELGFIQDGTFQLLKSYQVSIPQDLVLQGQVPLTANTIWNQFQRVYLEADCVLMTGNYDLSIQTDELISKNASISTGFNSKLASPGGRSGGKIILNSRTGTGSLNINLIGEAGADGANGAQVVTTRDLSGTGYWYIGDPVGKDGANGGNSGQAFVTVSEQHQMKILINRAAGSGGRGGLAGSAPPQANTFPRAGKPGADGDLQGSCIEDFRGRSCL